MLTTLVCLVSLVQAAQAPSCEDVASCRQAALEAADRQAFEAFHDLAWRALQRARRNDPELMLLLARAQSLSGRPADALVMLRRVAEIADARLAITSDDFARVRALPGWPEVEATIITSGEKHAPRLDPTPSTPEPRAARAAEAKTAPNAKPLRNATETPARSPAAPAAPPRVESPKPSDAPKLAEPPRRSVGAKSSGEEAIRLSGSSLEPVGLAYDNVSRRFVVGDRRQNRLIVADEVFKRVNDLIGPGSGGFGSLTAIEIDRQRGDLWVTSAGPNGHASIHKLQLVSGRVLTRIDVPEEWRPAALNDISMSDHGELLLVDGAGSRLLMLGSSAQVFARSVSLGVSSPASIAPAGALVYVAHLEGLAVVDLKSRAVTEIRPAKGVVLSGLRRIRWYQGSLVAIQDDPDAGGTRLVRIRINQSRNQASRLDPLDDQPVENGSVLTISNNSVYYLAHTDDGPVIRRVPLR